MKRSTPLRRSPIARSKRRPLKRTRLNTRSKKKEQEIEARKACMAIVIRRDKDCRAKHLIPDVACWGPLDGHEPLTRARGGDPTDPDQVILCCRSHHDHIHLNPAESTRRGLLKSQHTHDRREA